MLPNRDASRFYKDGYCFIGWSKSAEATEAEYENCDTYRDDEPAKAKVTTLYAVWVQIPVNARDIYLEYEDIDLIQDAAYMNEEAEISIAENAHEITLASSKITNLSLAYTHARTKGTEGSDYDLKATIVYSTGDSTEITFKLYVAAETHPTPKDNGASIRYIRKDTINSLRSTSSWLQADKNALLRDVLNKDLTKLKSYKVTKAKL